MAYVCELGPGQRLYLDNQGEFTAIARMMTAPGQQQQSSRSFETGAWTQAPLLFQTAQGIFIKLTTDRGEPLIQVQGQTLQVAQQDPELQSSQQIQMSVIDAMPGMAPMPSLDPMQPMASMPSPMQPMQPMTMGNMKMSLEPMQMQMGEMKMQMGSTSSTNANDPATTQRRFCTQCGQAVDPSDRFCASCGHALASDFSC